MKKEFFAPMSISSRMKSLGFDEYCCAYHLTNGDFHFGSEMTVDMLCAFSSVNYVKAPLYQQVIDWLLVKLIDCDEYIEVVYAATKPIDELNQEIKEALKLIK